MNARLRSPGGAVGTWSLVAAVLLGVVGVLGVVALTASLVVGGDFWSESASDKAWGLGFFAVITLGAVGFLEMDRMPVVGAALGVLAGLAMAVLLWWAILPVLVGVGIAVLAVKRALLLAHPAGGPSPAH